MKVITLKQWVKEPIQLTSSKDDFQTWKAGAKMAVKARAMQIGIISGYKADVSIQKIIDNKILLDAPTMQKITNFVGIPIFWGAQQIVTIPESQN
jgi:hypothetical protein